MNNDIKFIDKKNSNQKKNNNPRKKIIVGGMSLLVLLVIFMLVITNPAVDMFEQYNDAGSVSLETIDEAKEDSLNSSMVAPAPANTDNQSQNEESLKIDGEYIEIGTYPQSLKAEGILITNYVNNKGQYLGSDGEYYVKVGAINVVYYKVEKIVWKIISTNYDAEKDITYYTVLSTKALSACAYSDDNSSKYDTSDVREWLYRFYDYAIEGNDGAQYVVTTNVDNSRKSTGNLSNRYYCNNTRDKVFLLSSEEVVTLLNDEELRMIKPTEYAKSHNAYEHDDMCWWWLRSPVDEGYDNVAARVNYEGDIINSNVSQSGNCVVPAMVIAL